MKIKIKENLPVFIAACAALLHWIISFFTDPLIFRVPASANLPDYCICKALALLAAFAFYFVIATLLICRDKKNNPIWRCVLRALPYLPVMIAVVCVKLPQGYLSNDETLIAASALNLEHYTWFTYLTTWFYIICFMLIPNYLGPIFIKLLIELAVIGYVIDRIERVFGRPCAYFGYLLFLLYPVIAYTTSAHRLPVYFLLYLLFVTILLFDRIEQKPLSWPKELALIVLTAVLTQWRTEGIYLLVLSPILMLFVYPALRSKKNILLLFALSLLIQYLVSVPQNGAVASEMDAAADDRMKPFYAYTITNMFRNGLDEEKNAEDLAIVDQYLALDKIRAINDYYGDINYEDVLILYEGDFVGVREEAGVTEFFNYANALKRIFINNPDVLLRTRVGAFCYAALPYRIETGSGMVSLLVSIVKSLSYNLFIPLGTILILLIYALFRRRWFSFFLLGGVLVHWFIVFILAPASYFKYYFPVYITAYFYLLLLLLTVLHDHFFAKRNAQKKRILN